MSDTDLRTERRGAVLEILLDRPPANAIDAALSRRLGELFVGYRDDPALRVAIVSGAGERFFSAGWDLQGAEGEGEDPDYGPGGFAGLTELHDLHKPVIAAVNGLAVGGGFELVLACDLVAAVEHAEFFLPEAAIGLVPDAGGAIRLPRRLPHAIAMELLLTGRRMGAAEAQQRGLVNRVVANGELLAAARELAEAILANAPLAIAATAEIVRETETLANEQAFRRMRQNLRYRQMLQSEDAREGLRAFNEKRRPRWRGQ